MASVSRTDLVPFAEHASSSSEIASSQWRSLGWGARRRPLPGGRSARAVKVKVYPTRRRGRARGTPLQKSGRLSSRFLAGHSWPGGFLGGLSSVAAGARRERRPYIQRQDSGRGSVTPPLHRMPLARLFAIATSRRDRGIELTPMVVPSGGGLPTHVPRPGISQPLTLNSFSHLLPLHPLLIHPREGDVLVALFGAALPDDADGIVLQYGDLRVGGQID